MCAQMSAAALATATPHTIHPYLPVSLSLTLSNPPPLPILVNINFQLDTVYSQLRRKTSVWGISQIRLACEHACQGCLDWCRRVQPSLPLAGSPGLCENTPEGKPASSIFPMIPALSSCPASYQTVGCVSRKWKPNKLFSPPRNVC